MNCRKVIRLENWTYEHTCLKSCTVNSSLVNKVSKLTTSFFPSRNVPISHFQSNLKKHLLDTVGYPKNQQSSDWRALASKMELLFAEERQLKMKLSFWVFADQWFSQSYANLYFTPLPRLQNSVTNDNMARKNQQAAITLSKNMEQKVVIKWFRAEKEEK